MNLPTQSKTVEQSATLPGYDSILLAVDSSDHSNRGTTDAIALAGLWDARLTGTHVFAAKLHDVRFRQMEGGLPEQFRVEQELERQRDVHDDLITRGLSIITDSYLDQADRACREAGRRLERRSLEGKNYRELVRETNTGDYDLLVMGSLGLGAIGGSRLGTVCGRVARRSDIDVLVVKSPQRAVSEGPVVVAVDGSPRSYGGLLTALSLAAHWQVPVQVISAFDPYYHYVAFNRIAGVLSEEAGKVFRFKDQEKLHEEIIDSGLAKIYQGHLDVAQSIAKDFHQEVEAVLLDGKAHDAIEKHVRKVKPSLLVIGKLGVHADSELDIGGNAELLLHNVDCAVLLSQREHRPDLEVLADATTSWTVEAEHRLQKAPSFVQGMARMAILRYAQERGHTVITEGIVEKATAELMPGRAQETMAEIVAAHDAGEIGRPSPAGGKDAHIQMAWADEALPLLEAIADPSLRDNLRRRAEKKARSEKSATVQAHHIEGFVQPAEVQGGAVESEPHWQAAALARLARVPEGFMRNAGRERILKYARRHGADEVTLEIAEQGLAESRQAMQSATQNNMDQGPDSLCPFANLDHLNAATKPTVMSVGSPADGTTGKHDSASTDRWPEAALTRLRGVPKGFCREMTIKAVESIAARGGTEISEAFVEQVLDTFKSGAESARETMPWNPSARVRISRAPNMVRGMLVKEIEGWARRNGLGEVDEDAVEAVRNAWQADKVFHLDPEDPRNK